MDVKQKLKNYYYEKKEQYEEKKKKEEELENQARYNVYSWYKLYENNSRAAGVGFIMPETMEIYTSKSSYKHDSAAQVLFSRHYNKDLSVEEKDEDIPWFNLIPKYYNTICFELVSPYSPAGPNMVIFLPDKINEFQKEMLYKIQNEMDYYNESIKLKVKYHAGYKDDEADFDRIDDILDRYYNIDKINERSEYHGKI